MKKLVLTCLLLTSCVRASSVPLGNDMAEINISAHAIYGRAGAQEMAFNEAAETTIKLGYDKFIILSSNGWNEQTISGGSYGSFNAYGNQGGFAANGSQGSYIGSARKPESKLIIKMFKAGDKEAKKAIDARQVMAASNTGASQ